MRSTLVAMSAGLTLSCAGGSGGGGPTAPATKRAPTFADDLAFLRAHGDVIVLAAKNGARVAVSPAYQARVMTSATAEDGPSYGWIHRAFIESKKTGTTFDNYGGEDRLWLGPEGSRYSLFFAKGDELVFDHWQVPHALQEGAWAVTHQDAKHVRFAHTMHLTSRIGQRFDVAVERTVTLLEEPAVGALLGTSAQQAARGLTWVGFESENIVTNAGPASWTPETGLLSIWILGMYAPAHDGRVIVPFREAPNDPLVVNDAYFGKVPPGRLRVDHANEVVLFTCDGEHRSKIGLGPSHALPVLGSYSREKKLLTIVTYAPPADPDAPYVSPTWDAGATYGGDAVNSYNDGPVGPGKPSLGGFYEIETSSRAAALAPGGSLAHAQSTFHFVGDEAALDPLAQVVFGVSLADVAGR